MAVLGDIALIGYAADTGGKSFAFVLLADLSGQTIFFTDNGWTAAGAFRTGEGISTYVVPANTAIGTVVTISGLTGQLNPSTSGDQILAYVGSAAAPTFLYALDFADGNTSYAGDATNSNTSAVPTGLTFGTTALAFGADNGAYTGSLSGTRTQILANIANPANWTTDDVNPVGYAAGFTVTGGAAAAQVTINDVSISEGNAGTSVLTFTVTRSDATGAFSLDYATSNGTATAGSDYVATSGTISFTAGGALTQTISVTINGDTVTEGNETFTVALSNLVNTTGTAAISDATGVGTITNDDISVIAIHDIQGAAHTSPLVGQVVTTTGIVTAVDTNGFYLQAADADIDANVATSEAILVFTSSAPTVAVGDRVNVTGTVTEFTPGGLSSGNLSTTEITFPTVSVLSSGNALPTAIILGTGGRTPPTEIIDNDNFATFDPASDGIDFYESLEGMLVTVPSPLVVAPTTVNGELFTVANGGAGATGLSARGTIVTRGSTGDGLSVTNTGAGSDYNPERIQIDGDSFTPGGAGGIPLVAAGTVLNSVTGVVSYGFGNYEVLATTAVTVATPSILTGEVTSLAGNADTLTIASYNVLNLDPNDSDGDTDVADGRFTAIALHIVNALGTPDIIALQEIQDNSGSVNDGTISASVTLQMLVDAIAANGGPVYSFIDNPFITNNANGGQPGGNIRVAYLYDASRVALVDGSLATTPNAATDFAGARPPLVATFEFNGDNVTVINNHFSSKGGSSPLFGATQPSTNGSAADRLVQAQNVANYVTSLGNSTKLVVLGDLNEFTNEESLAPFGTAGLSSLSLTLAETERYSYNFEGNAQELDQIYVSGNLAAVTTLDIVHVNSEFVLTANSASDHDPSVIAITIAAPVAETQSVGFAPATLAQNEGNAGTTAFTFTVQRSGGTTGQVNFGGTVTLGTADAADFGGTAPTSFSGSILAGATTGTVTINVSGDTVVEPNETFSLALTSVSNGAGIATSIAPAAAGAAATITNDDVAPPPFGPGDVAFVGFNSDGNDNLALVALKALPSGTVLYFSDNEWTGTGFNDLNESTIALTLTSNVAAGGLITLDTIGTAASTTSNVGTVASVAGGGGNRGIANSGETVYVYIANPGTPLVPTAFLAAIANDGFTNSNGLLTGTGLTAGTTAIDLATVDAGADIGAFNGSRSNQTSFAAYLPTLNNAANWATQDAAGDQSVDTIFPDVPFSSTAFSLAAAAQTIGFASGSLARSVDEGNAGTRTLSFTVERSGGTTGALAFTGSFAAGTTDAADFGGTLPTGFSGSIAAGASSAVVTIAISGDTSVETNESFSLTLTGGSNPLTAGVSVNAGAATATGTIVNDDFPLAVGGINVYGAAPSLAGSVATPVASNDIVLVRLGSIQGSVAGAESVAFENGRAYATNINGNSVNVHRVTATGTLVNESPILLSALPSYRPGGVNSVDVKNGIVAVAYENIDPALPGFVALFNAADNSLIKTIQVGVLPDDVTFTPDGSKLLVANEAEALSAQGSVSIIDLSGGAANAFVSNTISFDSLNGAEAALRGRGLAIAPGQPAAGDIEPEYITVSADGTRAYVTLQEVNGVAVIDLTNPAADRPLSIQPLGSIDRNLPGNALDTSDQDSGINLRNVNIQSLPQPDAIASYTVGGVTYFVTANEGDARVNVADSVRLGSAGYVLDPTLYPNAAALKANADLGRLNVLTTIGDTDGDGDFDVIYTLGGRSISIFRQEADGSLTKVRETGGEFEAIIAANNPAIFNSNQSTAANSFDTRSDDKGPEPEGVTIGVVNGRIYAFVGLERVGGYMVYDVTDPANATFVSFRPQTGADLGPETSAFVAAADSPTGQALLLSAQEVSNTVTLYSIQTQSEGDDVINGGADGEIWNGRGGNDIITGNGGNDTINGGAGTDTARFAGAWVGYDVTTGGTVVVDIDTANGNDGTDTLTNVELLSFAGVSVAAADAVNDAPIGVNDNNVGDALVEDGDATAAGNVLTNDTDADAGLGLGETRSVTGVRAGNEAGGGTIGAVAAATVVNGTYGQLTINPDGTWSYALDNARAATQALLTGQIATESFTYRVADAHGLTDTAQLDLSITGANDAGDVLTGTADGETINGSDLGEIINALGGNDIVNGNGGDDIIDGGAGNDRLDGGAGIDTVSYASADSGVTINLGSRSAQNSVGAGTDALVNFENLLGSSFDDILQGDAFDNVIAGGAGNDRILGARGNDVLIGGAGDDILQGGDGVDTFLIDKVSNGAVDIITDLYLRDGDKLEFGPGISVIAAKVSFLSTPEVVNGFAVNNSARSLDLVLTLQSADGTQTLHVLDGYNFASNDYWEGVLGLDLTYPRPLPTGDELLPIA